MELKFFGVTGLKAEGLKRGCEMTRISQLQHVLQEKRSTLKYWSYAKQHKVI